jgi:hypothetical protein
VTTATNSVNLISLTLVNGSPLLANINFSNTAVTPAAAFFNNNGTNIANPIFCDCKFTGFTSAVSGAVNAAFGATTLQRCELTGCTSFAINHTSLTAPVSLTACNVHDNTGYAVRSSANSTAAVIRIIRSLITKNTGALTLNNTGPQVFVEGCTIFGSTSDAFSFSGAQPSVFLLENSIVYGGSAKGVNSSAPVINAANRVSGSSNAWGANAGGDAAGYTKAASDIALTANPFTNTASNDFSLNSAAGGGAACKGAGFQW